MEPMVALAFWSVALGNDVLGYDRDKRGRVGEQSRGGAVGKIGSEFVTTEEGETETEDTGDWERSFSGEKGIGIGETEGSEDTDEMDEADTRGTEETDDT
jgi:hypothetical protein